MTTDDLNSGELRKIKSFLTYENKLLVKLKENGDQIKIKKCKSNIKLYEDQIKLLEGK